MRAGASYWKKYRWGDTVGEPLFTCQDPGSAFVIEFVEVLAEGEGEPAALEQEEVRWVAVAEVKRPQLAPAEQAIREVPRLLSAMAVTPDAD